MASEINLAKALKYWMYSIDSDIIDDVLEFLLDKDCLNEKGKILRQEFWERYIKKEQMYYCFLSQMLVFKTAEMII